MHNIDDTTPVDEDECQPSRVPSFRRRDKIVRQPCEDKSAVEVANMTFPQYVEYFLSHPPNAGKRARLLSDERYCLLLELCMSGKTVHEFSIEHKLDRIASPSCYVQRRDADGQRAAAPNRPGWRTPLTGTAYAYAQISVNHAWAAHRLQHMQRSVKESRNRTTATRAAAAAHRGCPGTARLRTALSLATVTNQPPLNRQAPLLPAM